MKKIHVCCGGVYLEGYVNIDKYPFELGDDSRTGCVADVLADVFDLPYAKGSISEIVLIHGMEHFTRYDGELLLCKFAELLEPSGVLYLEMPSRYPVLVLTALERLVALVAPKRIGNRFGRAPASAMLWGNQWAGFDYETHRYLWSLEEVVQVGDALGLTNYSVFRYPASHVPFRDVGVAFSRSADISSYHPPFIKRSARRGFVGNSLGLFRGLWHVISGVFRAK